MPHDGDLVSILGDPLDPPSEGNRLWRGDSGQLAASLSPSSSALAGAGLGVGQQHRDPVQPRTGREGLSSTDLPGLGARK